MKIGDLVKHKTTGDVGVIIKIETRPVRGGKDLLLAHVHKTDGSIFPHPFGILEILNEVR